MSAPGPASQSKLLFTPGPLTTSETVKRAMLRDLGSRDADFLDIVRAIRRDLLLLCGPGWAEYDAVPIQGSGTFAVEAMISSCVPRDGSLLVLVNGAYGRRIVRIAQTYGIACATVQNPEDQPFTAEQVRDSLAAANVTHVAAVHCETTTGLLNPVEQIGPVVRAAGSTFLVDAMSSFAGVSLNVAAAEIDFRFEQFYELLSERGCVIYPGKLTTEPCFRVGSIGHISVHDIRSLLEAVRDVLSEMGVRLSPR